MIRFTLRALSLVATLAIVLILLLWTGFAVQKRPLEAPRAADLPIPVACTIRGCVTSDVWARQHRHNEAFARLTGEPPHSVERSLTTAIRRHLLLQTSHPPISREDVTRYRREVLHMSDDSPIFEEMNISLTEYEELVIRPLLIQESLKTLRGTETNEELYKLLSKENRIYVLLTEYTWNAQRGYATTRERRN